MMAEETKAQLIDNQFNSTVYKINTNDYILMYLLSIYIIR